MAAMLSPQKKKKLCFWMSNLVIKFFTAKLDVQNVFLRDKGLV